MHQLIDYELVIILAFISTVIILFTICCVTKFYRQNNLKKQHEDIQITNIDSLPA